MRVHRICAIDLVLPPPMTRVGRNSSRDCGGESRDTNRKNFVTHIPATNANADHN